MHTIMRAAVVIIVLAAAACSTPQWPAADWSDRQRFHGAEQIIVTPKLLSALPGGAAHISWHPLGGVRHEETAVSLLGFTAALAKCEACGQG
jgi:hypothetical protein